MTVCKRPYLGVAADGEVVRLYEGDQVHRVVERGQVNRQPHVAHLLLTRPAGRLRLRFRPRLRHRLRIWLGGRGRLGGANREEVKVRVKAEGEKRKEGRRD